MEARRLKAAEKEIQLSESLLLSGWGDGGYTALDAWEKLMRGFDQASGSMWWLPPTQPSDRRGGAQWPVWRTEPELNQFRQRSRVACVSNAYARGILRNLNNYAVGDGGKLEVVSKERLPDADRKQAGHQDPAWLAQQIARCQDVLDRWNRANHWSGTPDPRGDQAIGDSGETELLRRVLRDGEAFIRDFPDAGEDCLPVRPVEPECVRQPGTGAESGSGWTYGIRHRTEPFEDVRTRLEYCVYYTDPTVADNPENYELVPAGEMTHVLAPGTDSTIKRGIPEFSFSTLEALERAEKLQRCVSLGDQVRSSLAMVWKHTTGTLSQVSGLASGKADITRTNPANGQSENFERIRPGTILRTPANQEPVAVPANPSSEFLQAAQADQRQGGASLNLPEFMVGGNADTGSWASLKEAHTPPVKSAQSLQRLIQAVGLRLAWKALRYAAERGDIDPRALGQVEIQYELPAIVLRDEASKTQEDVQLIGAGVKSRKTTAMERGLDWEVEQANMQEEQAQAGPQGEGLGLGGAGEGPPKPGGPGGPGGGPKPPQPPGRPPHPDAAALQKLLGLRESDDAVGRKVARIEDEGVRGKPVPQKQAVAIALDMKRRGELSEAEGGGTDAQGGALPADAGRAKAVDFITYPEGVAGSNCGNCRWNRGGVCVNEKVSPGKDQPVTERNCCALWDAPGTLRDWQAGPVREADEDDADPDPQEQAELIADILGGIYGEKALGFIADLDAESDDKPAAESRRLIPLANGLLLLEAWDAGKHPRGKGGVFIKANSAEAHAAAKEAISAALKEPPSADGMKKLTEHLSILTVKQLHDLKAEHGLSASGRLKEELVSKLADRLNKGRRGADAPKPTGGEPSYKDWAKGERERNRAAGQGPKPEPEPKAEPAKPAKPKEPWEAAKAALNSGDVDGVVAALRQLPHKELERQADKAGFGGIYNAKTKKELIDRIRRAAENNTPEKKAARQRETEQWTHRSETERLLSGAKNHAAGLQGAPGDAHELPDEAFRDPHDPAHKQAVQGAYRKRIQAAVAKMDPDHPENAKVIAAARQAGYLGNAPEPERGGEQGKESDRLPPQVRSQVEHAVGRLQGLADALEQGRRADRQFRGEGRYEADALRNYGGVEGARKTLGTFREMAKKNGVDADRALAELGLPPEDKLTPSSAAGGWHKPPAPDAGRAAEPTKAQAAAKPAPAAATPHAATASAIDRLAGQSPGGLVSLADLKDAVGSGTSMADFHKTLKDLWHSGAVSFEEIEGRGGVSPREDAAALKVPSSRGHDSRLGHVYVTDPEKLRAYLSGGEKKSSGNPLDSITQSGYSTGGVEKPAGTGAGKGPEGGKMTTATKQPHEMTRDEYGAAYQAAKERHTRDGRTDWEAFRAESPGLARGNWTEVMARALGAGEQVHPDAHVDPDVTRMARAIRSRRIEAAGQALGVKVHVDPGSGGATVRAANPRTGNVVHVDVDGETEEAIRGAQKRAEQELKKRDKESRARAAAQRAVDRG